MPGLSYSRSHVAVIRPTQYSGAYSLRPWVSARGALTDRRKPAGSRRCQDVNAELRDRFRFGAPGVGPHPSRVVREKTRN
jgi:hypothetical protein